MFLLLSLFLLLEDTQSKPHTTLLCPNPGSAALSNPKRTLTVKCHHFPSCITGRKISLWDHLLSSISHIISMLKHNLHTRKRCLIQPPLPAAAAARGSPSSVRFESLACLLFPNSSIVINTIDWWQELNRRVFWSWNINPVFICRRNISRAFKHCLASQPKAFFKCNLSHAEKLKKPNHHHSSPRIW